MRFREFLNLNEWIVYPKDLRNRFISDFEHATLLIKSNDIVKGEELLSKIIKQIAYNLKMLVKQKETFNYDFETEYNFSKELYEKIYNFNKNEINSRLSIMPFEEFSKRYLE